MRQMLRSGFWAGCCALVLLSGCASPSTATEPTPAVELTPYFTRTPAVSPSGPTPSALPSPAAPTASPTPQTYRIARNDTLTSIARHFGLTLDALMAANPGLNANSLQVGQNIKIPFASQTPDTAGAVTPEPLDVGPGFCLPSGGGIYCYVPVHNPSSNALENISLKISLLDGNGQTIASQQAILPLNILQPDQVLPAGVFFNGASGGVTTRAQGQVLTAIRLSPGDPRYLQTSLQNLLVSTAWDGLSASVEGKIVLASGKPASRLWLAAVAYDDSGQIVGSRRWEWNGTLKPGDSQPFSTAVYSLGPAIEKVVVLVEARP